MQRSVISGQRLVALFFVGLLLLNYPVLSLFDRAVDVFGIPLLFLYIFVIWGCLIGLVAWLIDGRGGAR